MYVLEGTLVTHEGRYGPGHFVWFPEGNVMEHGATAEQDVTVLFVTNKPFDIHYQEKKERWFSERRAALFVSPERRAPLAVPPVDVAANSAANLVR
jgi:hypothetical protein